MAFKFTRAYTALKRQLAKADSEYVTVGIIASKGGNADHDGITMVELAAIHEFGSPAAHIPERSFIRSTFNNKRPQMLKLCAKLAKGVVEHGVPVAQALELLGAWGAAEVRKTITSGKGVPPPNAPSTIERKGSTRPLVDTGRLLNAVTHLVHT